MVITFYTTDQVQHMKMIRYQTTMNYQIAYGDEIVPIPPDGFLFENEYFGEEFLGYFNEDTNVIDEKYIYERPEEVNGRKIDNYIFESYGVNGRINFPEDLIDIMIKQRRIFIPPHNIDKHKKIILEALNIKQFLYICLYESDNR